ncbi:hypothetical protein NX059_000899 [Plenodomus lindquistii]|nr:hypothetical protein NX059_000899 [Plenodomus lindquistii]
MATITPRRSGRNTRSSNTSDLAEEPGPNSRHMYSVAQWQPLPVSPRQTRGPSPSATLETHWTLRAESRARKEIGNYVKAREDNQTEYSVAGHHKSLALRTRSGLGSGGAQPKSLTPSSIADTRNKPKVRSREEAKTQSLVMIFSKDSVRRGSHVRKADGRMQKRSRRMKFWRNITGHQPMFDWD